MKKFRLTKGKVLLAFAALVMTAACESKKNDTPAAAGGNVEASCFSDPTSCSVGQLYSVGYYLASTANQGDISSRRAIDLKLAFYGSDGDAVYRSASNQNIFYTGAVSAIGTANITIQDRDESSAPTSNFGSNSDRRCRIPEGEYKVITFQEGQWTQRPARKNADNDAKIEAIALQMESNGNMISAVLDNAAVNFRKEGLQLTGTLIIQRVNKQNCQVSIEL